jgi:hypothetical protein
VIISQKTLKSELDISKLSRALDDFWQLQRWIVRIQDLAEKDLAQDEESMAHERLETLETLHHAVLKKQKNGLLLARISSFFKARALST